MAMIRHVVPPMAIPAVCDLLNGAGLGSAPPAAAVVDEVAGGVVVLTTNPFGPEMDAVSVSYPLGSVDAPEGTVDAPESAVDAPEGTVDPPENAVDASDGLAEPPVEADAVAPEIALEPVALDRLAFPEVLAVSTLVGVVPVVSPVRPVVTEIPTPDELTSEAFVEPEVPAVEPGAGSVVGRPVTGVVVGFA